MFVGLFPFTLLSILRVLCIFCKAFIRFSSPEHERATLRRTHHVQGVKTNPNIFGLLGAVSPSIGLSSFRH